MQNTSAKFSQWEYRNIALAVVAQCAQLVHSLATTGRADTRLVNACIAPLLVLTPKKEAARRLGLLWGAHAVPTKDIGSFEEMIAKGKRMALRHGIGKAGAKLVMMAGVPFGTPGSTNVLHVATLTGDELRGYS